MDMRFVWKILIWCVFVLIILYLLVSYSIPKKQKLSYGVTFSQKFSAELVGDKWKQNYLAVLDDLKIKDLRLIAYWNIIEPEKGKFDFSDLDWQFAEAQKRGAKIILVVGRKTPRWPECHDPAWAKMSDVSYDDSLLGYVRETVNHYKNSPSLEAWQVENEPLFPFGECGTTPISLLNQEIKLVKSLSDKPVILTDSGELGFAWPYLAAKSDIFGTTLYRYINNRFLGDIRYSLIPAYYFRVKAWWAEKVVGKQILISELQAEPWNNGAMNPEIFKEIIDYAERSGFPKAYLWGAEWWYVMKEKQGKPEMWEAVKDLINKK